LINLDFDLLVIFHISTIADLNN